MLRTQTGFHCYFSDRSLTIFYGKYQEQSYSIKRWRIRVRYHIWPWFLYTVNQTDVIKEYLWRTNSRIITEEIYEDFLEDKDLSYSSNDGAQNLRRKGRED